MGLGWLLPQHSSFRRAYDDEEATYLVRPAYSLLAPKQLALSADLPTFEAPIQASPLNHLPGGNGAVFPPFLCPAPPPGDGPIRDTNRPFSLSMSLSLSLVAHPFVAPPSLIAGEQSLGADPLPDAAAKRFDSWRKTRHLGLTGGAAADGVDSLTGIPPGVATDARGGGGGAGGMWGRAGGEMGGDVLNREAFEALLPCIFHADAVHDEVRFIVCGMFSTRCCTSSMLWL